MGLIAFPLLKYKLLFHFLFLLDLRNWHKYHVNKMFVCVCSLIMSDALQPHGLQRARLPCSWNFGFTKSLIDNLKLSCNYMLFSSVQFSAQSCPTLCNPMNRSTPGHPVHHQLPEFTQTHVHSVSDAIQPSHPLSSPSPFAPQSLPASESFPVSQLFA